MSQFKNDPTLKANNSLIEVQSDRLAEELVELSKEEVSQKIFQIVELLRSEVSADSSEVSVDRSKVRVNRSFKLVFTDDTTIKGGIKIAFGDGYESHDNLVEIIHERINLYLIDVLTRKDEMDNREDPGSYGGFNTKSLVIKEEDIKIIEGRDFYNSEQVLLIGSRDIRKDLFFLCHLSNPNVSEIYGYIDNKESTVLVVPNYSLNLKENILPTAPNEEKLDIMKQFIQISWFALNKSIFLPSFDLENTLFSFDSGKLMIKVVDFNSAEIIKQPGNVTKEFNLNKLFLELSIEQDMPDQLLQLINKKLIDCSQMELEKHYRAVYQELVSMLSP